MRIASILIGMILATSNGCGEHGERDVVVPLDKVPAAVMKTASEQLPGVKFETAWKEMVDGKEAYEIRGKTKEGKVRDCKIAAGGKVLEVD